MEILTTISDAIVDGKNKEIVGLIEQALDQKIDAITILNDGLIKGMDEVGKLWNEGEIFIPEVLLSARTMASGSSLIEEVLLTEGHKPIAKAVIGTVKGDLHDIGKNLVGMMLKGKGFEVIDLGVDVSKEQYFDAVKKHDAKFVICSSLITTTMSYMKDVISYFEEQGLRDEVTIACGGAPVTQTFADTIGADVYTDDAVQLSKKLLEMVEA
jgi:corrinoid protein of di/trimethylamine methyltransferase